LPRYQLEQPVTQIVCGMAAFISSLCSLVICLIHHRVAGLILGDRVSTPLNCGYRGCYACATAKRPDLTIPAAIRIAAIPMVARWRRVCGN
jgi:hypothetical protein